MFPHTVYENAADAVSRTPLVHLNYLCPTPYRHLNTILTHTQVLYVYTPPYILDCVRPYEIPYYF